MEISSPVIRNDESVLTPLLARAANEGVAIDEQTVSLTSLRVGVVGGGGGGNSSTPSTPSTPRLSGGADMSSMSMETSNIWDSTTAYRPVWEKYVKWFKIFCLLICWTIFTLLLLLNAEYQEELFMFNMPVNDVIHLNLSLPLRDNRLGLTLYGAFEKHGLDNANVREFPSEPNKNQLIVEVECVADVDRSVTANWTLPLVDTDSLEHVHIIRRQHTFELMPNYTDSFDEFEQFRVFFKFRTNAPIGVPLEASIQLYPVPSAESLTYALLLLIGMYTLFMLDTVHRSLVAIMSCTFAIGILALMNARPTITEIIRWVDIDTLMLLFGMSIVVTIFADTGILDYLAVLGYELANGHIWPILNCMCLATALLAAIMDNIAVLLIMSPITIRICEVIGLDPVPVLICVIVSSNIGAALTPMGDEPNIAITENDLIIANGITYGVYVMHVAPGVILAMLQTYAHLRIYYSNSSKMRFKSPPEVERLRHVIRVWKMAARSVSTYSKGEQEMRTVVNTKVRSLRNRMKRLGKKPLPTHDYEENLKILKATYPIRDKNLLIKCSVVFSMVVLQFMFNTVPSLHTVELGWIAVLGALLLLIIADIEDLEGILARIEWSTLLFLTGLYVFTEAMFRLGLLDYIGDKVEDMVREADSENRLAIAILLILWVSAGFSAFLANLTVANMMLRIIFTMSGDPQLNLPLQPLLWALVMGVCFGGNGSLVGATANVVGAGVVERHGYTFSFMYYLKVGFPIMIGNILMATAYLMIAHVYFEWH